MAALNSPGKNVSPFEEGFIKTGSAEMCTHTHTQMKNNNSKSVLFLLLVKC